LPTTCAARPASGDAVAGRSASPRRRGCVLSSRSSTPAATASPCPAACSSPAHTGDPWPRPGRILAAARTTTFEQLADAIDDAFARWDRNHLHEFTLADGTAISPARWWKGEEPERSLDGSTVRLGRLRPGEQFAAVFDLGDNWQHLCTVASRRVDPLEVLGVIPEKPLPFWGWGTIPDQYGRDWDGDDGDSPRGPPRTAWPMSWTHETHARHDPTGPAPKPGFVLEAAVVAVLADPAGQAPAFQELVGADGEPPDVATGGQGEFVLDLQAGSRLRNQHWWLLSWPR
jgi:hypothetical protein